MNAYSNLPAPLRLGIPLIGVFMLGLVLWMTMFKAPAPVNVIKTQNFDTYTQAKDLLTSKSIDITESSNNGTFELAVDPSDKNDAINALSAGGIRDTTVNAKKIVCEAAPGFTANKAKVTEYENCQAAKTVQTMLLGAGVVAADVKVAQVENGTLIGPETSKSVAAQVTLPKAMQNGQWNASNAALQIATAVGTSTDLIYIGDEKMQPLFNGAKGDTAGSADGAASGNACSEMATATEIATKEAAVRSCYESTIAEKLTAIVGGTDRFVLTVAAEVDAVSTTTQSETSTRGPVTSESKQSGAGNSTTDITSPPNTKVETTQKAAGDIGKLSLSVALDKTTVNANQELAVKRILQTYVDSSRKDPTPVVTRFAFPKGTGSVPKAPAPAATTTDPAADQTAMGGGQTKTETPKPVLALLAVLAIGLVAAMLIMWRRAVAMKEERARMESAFQNDQRLFENFAQQNPEALAQDLEAMFGLPAAQR